jgi:FkbM family methyltransferase
MSLSQFIINRILNSNKETLSGKIQEKFFRTVRDILYEGKKTLITYDLNGKNIILPVVHDLPLNKKLFPLYSDNLGRIAFYLTSKYDDLKVIDIGANVGDSVFIIKSKADVPVLCIEGNDYFYSILEKNVSGWNDVFMVKSFIGDKTESRAGYLFSKGSGRIRETEDSKENISFDSLSDIVKQNPAFENAKLIKIDTDGFDCRIIRDSLGYFNKSKPVIFFEYDPFLLQQLKDDGLSVFDALSGAGYDTVMFYDNNGDYLLTSEINLENIIKDIHYYYSGRNIEHYCDICVFHKEDSDIAGRIRDEELKFFAERRNYKI